MTKKTKAKMRKGAWSAESRAKAAATRAANKAKNLTNSPSMSDALAYLTKAEKIILSGKLKRVGPAETLVFLALNSLRGEL